ncbi:MAG: hypothetical protein V1907_03945 [Candidatus Kerfeldbacteria bacterium]
MKRTYKILGISFGILVAVIVAVYLVWWNVNPVLPGTPKFVREWIAKQPKIVNDNPMVSVFVGSTADKCASQGITYYALTIAGSTEYYSESGDHLCSYVAKQLTPTDCPSYIPEFFGDCSTIWKSKSE